MSSVSEAKDGLILVAGLAGIGIFGYFFYKGYKVKEDIKRGVNELVEDPVTKTSTVSQDFSRVIGENSLGKTLKNTVGIDLNLKTFGTNDSAQDNYDASKFMNEHKGVQQGLQGVTAAVAVNPLVNWTIPVVGVVNNITKKIKQGVDRNIANAKVPEKDELITLKNIQTEIVEQQRTSHTYDISKMPLVEDPMKLLQETEKNMIGGAAHASATTHFKNHELYDRAEKIYVLYHALKTLQLKGLFLNDTDKAFVGIGPAVIATGIKKNYLPKKGPYIIAEKKFTLIKNFLKSRPV